MDTQKLDFLEWLSNRLIYKHRYDINDPIIKCLQKLVIDLKSPTIVNITTKELDKIIQKYYVDYFFDKEEDLGFTEEERVRLRETILGIVHDILNKDK